MLRVLKQIAHVGLLSEPLPAPNGDLRAGQALQAEIARVFARAVNIRHVDAGSCNGCELEIHALENPYYNLQGAGIKFVASPRHADLLLMSPEHYEAYDAATVAIQRLSRDGGGLAKLGFSTLEYIGGGKRAEIVLDGGIGSNMPANTTYGLDTDSLRLRFNPSRNFDKLFEGDGQKPINQDALAQFIGWMGELTMTNPQMNWRLYDSVPAS